MTHNSGGQRRAVVSRQDWHGVLAFRFDAIESLPVMCWVSDSCDSCYPRLQEAGGAELRFRLCRRAAAAGRACPLAAGGPLPSASAPLTRVPVSGASAPGAAPEGRASPRRERGVRSRGRARRAAMSPQEHWESGSARLGTGFLVPRPSRVPTGTQGRAGRNTPSPGFLVV